MTTGYGTKADEREALYYYIDTHTHPAPDITRDQIILLHGDAMREHLDRIDAIFASANGDVHKAYEVGMAHAEYGQLFRESAWIF